jgi:hypothetical protein
MAPEKSRALVGRILLASAALMLVLAAVIWSGVLGIEPGARSLVAGVVVAAAVLDGLIGLYFVVSEPS